MAAEFFFRAFMEVCSMLFKPQTYISMPGAWAVRGDQALAGLQASLAQTGGVRCLGANMQCVCSGESRPTKKRRR